ncbi:hypothetical protein tinsulaeT_29830 [Thalassotalea insulae]|uniref:Solute-binding protein family 3/N-terminal domain-containing protein n=1 Tax=Thalassotalea insulae TaxID=2056778 RepID=A0ABQ6GUN0_9GAMM|nr:transporter substrate-binding domain-containing protein [Thalassotalea insulae]GLX79643.1 hypothetical protein tinsulaeT_29830 [Thalassotalea insulae]
MSLLFIFLSLLFSITTNAEQVNVGLEPFPPLINEDKTGVLIEALNQIALNSELSFNFQLMTYARAKKELKKGNLQLIGLTPQHQETPDFYQYAQELNWSIDTTLDIFSLQPSLKEITQFEDFTIGTLIGNAEFFSQTLTIPQKKFVEVSSLPQLVKMLSKGRIKAIIFERIATMTTIEQLQTQGIYYQKIINLPASIAVQKNELGFKLKKQLDKLLSPSQLMTEHVMLSRYYGLPDSGLVDSSHQTKK